MPTIAERRIRALGSLRHSTGHLIGYAFNSFCSTRSGEGRNKNSSRNTNHENRKKSYRSKNKEAFSTFAGTTASLDRAQISIYVGQYSNVHVARLGLSAIDADTNTVYNIA